MYADFFKPQGPKNGRETWLQRFLLPTSKQQWWQDIYVDRTRQGEISLRAERI